MLRVEVVYVPLTQKIFHCHLELAEGTTVADALEASAVYGAHPDAHGCLLGIYAKRVTLETRLKEGDRVELYRPLSLDPKENRRQKAKKKRV